jgi:type 1 glutamine amidotransferase
MGCEQRHTGQGLLSDKQHGAAAGLLSEPPAIAKIGFWKSTRPVRRLRTAGARLCQNARPLSLCGKGEGTEAIFPTIYGETVMCARFHVFWVVLLTACASISCAPPDGQVAGTKSPAVQDSPDDSDLLRVAVVTGGHAFDVPNFYRLWRQLPGIDAYPQHLEHFSSSPEEVRDAYHAVVFYGMDQGVPEEEGRRAAGNPKAAIERIVEQGQGVVVLHHALLAWEKWDFWNDLIGFDNRNFRYKEGIELNVGVADDSHPANRGASGFNIIDEGYVLHGTYDDQGAILLTVDHEDAMEQVAWAREHGSSRVFCLTLGHDNQAWTNPAFRDALTRGLTWVAANRSPDST